MTVYAGMPVQNEIGLLTLLQSFQWQLSLLL